LIGANQNDETKRQIHIADDFAATVRSLFRFREKETQNFFSAPSAPLLFLCAEKLSLSRQKMWVIACVPVPDLLPPSFLFLDKKRKSH
jgi:hypothetical protein